MSKALHRGRFAPSPTGHLHLGNARTALLGWLWARSERGEFLLRIEDLDASRCRPEYLRDLEADLRWLGVTFDAPRLVQSERKALYDAALQSLGDRIYPCFCTRAEIARAASAPHGASDDGPRYPGTCAALSEAEREARSRQRAPALRFRAHAGLTAFTDVLEGRFEQDVQATAGDFVVRRNDGVASYQLAVVVDDADSAITHVLRGADLTASTPRQLQLYQALHKTPPVHAHVGLVLGPDGKRLAKREGLRSLTDLRLAGVASERVLGLLGLWCGLGDGSPATLPTLLERFALEKVPQGTVQVTVEAVAQVLGPQGAC